jgi:cytochrome c biogenesis protein CcdA
MTPALVAGITGLALLDSLNPATILVVALVLLLPGRRRVASALAFVAGAYATVLGLGAMVYLAAGAAADTTPDGLVWVRRVAFGLAALLLLVSAVRRLRGRDRGAVALPAWFSPWTAFPLGVVVTGADLPNAFPYVIAIERLVAAGPSTPTSLLVVAGYAAVYCLPCLVLLALGRWKGDRVRARLRPLYERFGSARHVPASVVAAAGLTVAAGALLGVAASA